MTVIVEAVHVVRPLTNATPDRWVEWYGNEVMPAMARNGFDVLGAFKRSTGPGGEDVLLMRFENMTAYERAGVSLRNDAGFLKALGGAAAFEVRESVKVAALVPFATERRLEKALAERPAKPRHFLQAVLQVRAGQQLAAYDAMSKIADMIEGAGAGGLVTAYETTVGQRGELTGLWAYPGPLDTSYVPGDPFGEVLVVLRKAAPEESNSILNPLPYSRLR